VPKQSKTVVPSRCPSAGAPDAFLRAVLSFLLFLCLLGPSAAAQEPAPDTLKHYLAALVGSIGGHVSLDGRYIAFVDWSTGNVAVHEIDTGKYRLLSHKGSWLDSDDYAQSPRISFDGRTVAYAWVNDEGFYELRVVGIDGSAERVLYRDESVPYVEPLDWFPDGKRVLAALAPEDGDLQLAWVSLADGSLQLIKTFAEHGPFRVRCSPDGRYVAYDLPSTVDPANRDIFLLTIDGSDKTVLIARPGDDRVIDWTPDSERLLFASGEADARGSWIVQVVDGERRGDPKLVYPDVPWQGFGFTREGAYYYCCGPSGGTPVSGANVFLVDRDPETGRLGTPRKTIEDIENKTSVAWSADGSRLVYVKWPRVLVLHTLESGEERAIPSGISRPRSPLYPRWTSDGRSLIAQGRRGLYRVDIESGVKDAIVEVEECCFTWSVWSPGRRIFFTRWRSEKRGEPVSLLARDLDTGRETELYRVTSPVSLANLTASPDGHWLAFVEWDMEDGSASLKLMPVGGGEPQSLLAFSQVSIFRRPLIELTWTPDSRHIVYVISPTSQPWSPGQEIRQLDWETGGEYGFEFRQIPVGGGEPRPLGLSMETLIPYGLSIAPDGRRLAFTAGPLSQQFDPVWALENFLPALERQE
jgi:Tol biopolymer transport system component